MTDTNTLVMPTDMDAIAAAFRQPGVTFKSTETGELFTTDTPDHESYEIAPQYTGANRFNVVVPEDAPTTDPVKRFSTAMRQIRKGGVHARSSVKMCCRSCISADAERKLGYTDEMDTNEIPLVWSYGSQGRSTADLRAGGDINLNHSHITPEVYEIVAKAFTDNGLEVEWDGTVWQTITVTDLRAVEHAARIKRFAQVTRLANEMAYEARMRRYDILDRQAEIAREDAERQLEVWAKLTLVDPDLYTIEQKEAMYKAGGTK